MGRIKGWDASYNCKQDSRHHGEDFNWDWIANHWERLEDSSHFRISIHGELPSLSQYKPVATYEQRFSSYSAGSGGYPLPYSSVLYSS